MLCSGPVQLAHSSDAQGLCDFTRHLLQPRLDTHPTKYLLTAGELCDKMPSAFGSEILR